MLKMVMRPLMGSTTKSVIMLIDEIARLKDSFSLPTSVANRIMAGGYDSIWSVRIKSVIDKHERMCE